MSKNYPFYAFYLEFKQRDVDRGVRIRFSKVHALPDGKGLKALETKVEALAKENVSMSGINLSKG